MLGRLVIISTKSEASRSEASRDHEAHDVGGAFLDLFELDVAHPLRDGDPSEYETIRTWCARFGPKYALQLRQRAPRPCDKWHLNEVSDNSVGHIAAADALPRPDAARPQPLRSNASTTSIEVPKWYVFRYNYGTFIPH